MGEELTRDEIRELATVFPPPRAARSLLRAAGFPMGNMPGVPDTSLAFWEQVAESLADGVMRDGRRAILTEALSRYPANKVFKAGLDTFATPLDEPVSRVLVMGASPRGLERIRWDRETKAIIEAGPGRLDVKSCPAASVSDLDLVRRFRPEVVHLSCHGDGENLIFEDRDGEPHEVPATAVADTLRLYTGGSPLRGLVLRSCHSEAVAALFTDSAERVIAHRGTLDDTCAVEFARLFYEQLQDTPDLRTAACHAAQATRNLSESCASILSNLIVLPHGD